MRKGIVLILVSGLMTGLSLVSVLLMRLARFTAAADEARQERSRAGLVAESGLAYAAGRLAEGTGYPSQGGLPADRGDDWTFRDGLAAGIHGAANPSYSHGEGWDEVAGSADRYDPGLDDVSGTGAWTDLDGDGKFSAWSGRLRLSDTPFQATFALKIVSAGGLFPVDFQPDPAWTTPPSPGLARIGDNLGAILLDPAAANADVIQRANRPYTVGGMTGEPIRISALGRHLLFGEDFNQNTLLDSGEDANGNGVLDPGRPRYGYRSAGAVRAALSVLGYTPGQIDTVLPYLDFGPYEMRAGSGAETAQIELATAPREILESIWRYVSFFPSDDTFVLRKSATEWLGLPYGVPGVRSGGAVDYTQGTAGASVMIYPDEAEELADWAIEFRRTSRRASWLAFRRELCGEAAPDPVSRFFQDDVAPLLAAGWPDAAWGWARAKADAAFYAVSKEGNYLADLVNWRGWGIDPGPGLPPGGVVRPFTGIEALSPVAFPVPARTGAWTASPYRARLSSEGPAFLHALTLAPPTQYRVQTAGRSGRAQALAGGRLAAAERLEFTSQEDLDNVGAWSAYPKWTDRGIAIVDLPNKNLRRRTVSDSVEDLTTAAALPIAPPPPFRGAVTGGGCNPNGVGGAGSTLLGIVGLAGKYTAHQGAYLYWPFQPDDIPRMWFYQEAEWQTKTRGPLPPLVLAPDPPVYRSLAKNAPGSSVGAISPWMLAAGNTTGDACSPLDFPPLTLGPVMRDFSVEWWTTGVNTLFELAADAVLPVVDDTNPAQREKNDIVLKVTRLPDLDAADRKGKTYTVLFKAPSDANITVVDDNPHDMIRPPPEGMYHYGGYMIEFTAFVPDVDSGRFTTGHDHLVVTVENAEVSEDTNGNGVLDPREDTNGDGTLGPKKDLTVTLYVNGILAGSEKDSQSINQSVPVRFQSAGRAYPSHPRPTYEDAPLQETRLIRFSGDEVRFYDGVKRASGITDLDGDGSPDEVLKEEDVDERYRLGRFFLPPDPYPSVNNPEYISPAYDLGIPARIRCAGWTGIPAGDPSGAERVGMTVKAGVPALAGGVPTVNGPEMKDSLELTDAACLAAGGLGGPVQLLGFSVEFSNLDPGNRAPLYATPLFEGIWFQIQGRGRTPAWIARD